MCWFLAPITRQWYEMSTLISHSGLPGRYAMQAMKQMEPQVKQAIQSFPKTVRARLVSSMMIVKQRRSRRHPLVPSQAFGGGYYRGGFEPKMNRREAALILGVRYVRTED